MTDLLHTLAPGDAVRLRDLDTESTDSSSAPEKKAGQQRNLELQERLEELQRKFYADGRHSLLIVFQGMDTSGKDGTIRRALGSFSPQGVQVHPFKVPSEEEMGHDYLWRIHQHTPRKGMIAVFNRSHYEDVLVVRVKSFVPKSVWSRRYDHINDFERLLTDCGTKIVKIFLHISPEEQKERLLARLETPTKNWKFNPGDLEDRDLWNDFQSAYEDALTRCTTDWAPWHVVPADRKWYRDLAISELLIETFEGLDLRYPDPPADLDSYEIADIG